MSTCPQCFFQILMLLRIRMITSRNMMKHGPLVARLQFQLSAIFHNHAAIKHGLLGIPFQSIESMEDFPAMTLLCVSTRVPRPGRSWVWMPVKPLRRWAAWSSSLRQPGRQPIFALLGFDGCLMVQLQPQWSSLGDRSAVR